MSFHHLAVDSLVEVASHLTDPVDLACFACVNRAANQACHDLAQIKMMDELWTTAIAEVTGVKDVMCLFSLELADMRFGATIDDVDVTLGTHYGYDDAVIIDIDDMSRRCETTKILRLFPGFPDITWRVVVEYSPPGSEHPRLDMQMCVDVSVFRVFELKNCVAPGVNGSIEISNLGAGLFGVDHGITRAVAEAVDILFDYFQSDMFHIDFDIPAIFVVE